MKPKFAAVFFTVSVLSMQIDAAPSRVESRRNQSSSYSNSSNYRKDDVTDSIRKLSSQIREMQDQITHLKAAQNSITSDSMVKSLSPKIRKMEMQVEYLEKKVRDLPTYSEFKKLLVDYDQLKAHLEDSPSQDGNSEEALAAISPVINRMQKQILYLYQKYKSQEGEGYSILEDKCAQLHREIDSIQSSVKAQQEALSLKLAHFQQGVSSLSALKDTIIQSSHVVNDLQGKYISLKDEMAKLQVFPTELTAFKEEMKKNQALIVNGMKILNNKINTEQATIVKTEIEKSLSQVSSQFGNIANELTQYQQMLGNFEQNNKKLAKAVIILNKKIKEGSESSDKRALELKQNVDALTASISQLQQMTANRSGEVNLLEINSRLDLTKRQMSFLYSKFKEYKTDSGAQKEAFGVFKLEHDRLMSKTQEFASQLSNIEAFVKSEIAQVNDKISASLEGLMKLSVLKPEELASRFDLIKKQVNALYQQSKKQGAQLSEQEKMAASIKSDLERKEAILGALYEQMNDLKTKTQSASLNMQQQLIDVSRKLALFQTSYEKLKDFDVEGIDSKFASMSNQISYLYRNYKQIQADNKQIATLNEKLAKLESKLAEKTPLEVADSTSSTQMELVKKQITYLYNNLKEIKENQNNSHLLGEKLKEKLAKIEELQLQVESLNEVLSSSLTAFEKKISRQEPVVPSEADAANESEKNALIEALSLEVETLKKELAENKSAIRSVKDLDEKITQLQRQNAFLYSKLKSESDKTEVSTTSEDNAQIMQKLSELSEKVENLSSPSAQSDLSAGNVEEELKKRDDEISKLKRRVMYLYSKSRESLDNNPTTEALADKFNAMRDELEAKIKEHLDSSKKDKQVIHSLLEKVANLEEALKAQEEAKDDSLSDEDFKG